MKKIWGTAPLAHGLGQNSVAECAAQGAITPMVQPAADALSIVRDGVTTASVVMLPDVVAPPPPKTRKEKPLPDPYASERQAGEDLVKYIEMMSGARPRLVLGEI